MSDLKGFQPTTNMKWQRAYDEKCAENARLSAALSEARAKLARVEALRPLMEGATKGEWQPWGQLIVAPPNSPTRAVAIVSAAGNRAAIVSCHNTIRAILDQPANPVTPVGVE